MINKNSIDNQNINEFESQNNSLLDIENALQMLVNTGKELSGAVDCRIIINQEMAGKILQDLTLSYVICSIHSGKHAKLYEVNDSNITISKPASIQINKNDTHVHHVKQKKNTQNQITIPVRVNGNIIGELIAVSFKTKTFSAHHNQLLAFLAVQAGIALENAKLFQETQRKANILHQLYKLGTEIRSTMDIKVVLEKVADTARTITEASDCNVVILDSDGKYQHTISVPSSVNDTASYIGTRPGGLTETIVSTGQCVIITNLTKEQRANPNTLARGVLSQVGMPIQIGGKTIGALFAHSFELNAFNQHHQELLSFLAAQSGIAIENVRLFQETKQRLSELQQLYELGKRMTSTLEIETVLQMVVDSAQSLSGAADTDVLIFSGKEGLRGVSITSSGVISPMPYTPLRQGGLTEEMMRTGKPLIIPDIRKDPRINPRTLERGIHSEIGIPIIVNGQMIGTLFAHSRKLNAFNKYHQELLSFLSAQAGIALENARLFQETKQRFSELQQLYELGKRMTSTLEIETVLKMVVDSALKLTKAIDSNVHFFSGDGGTYGLSIDKSGAISPMTYTPIRPGGLTDEILKNGNPLIIPDIDKNPRVNQRTRDRGIRSQVLIPIVAGGSIIGTLSAHSKVLNAFNEYDLELLSFLAAQAGIAIENARLFQETKQRAGELEQANNEIKNNQQQLLISEKMASIGRLTAGIAHELNTPIAAIRAALSEQEKLINEYSASIGNTQVTPDDHKEIINEMYKSIHIATRAAQRTADFVSGIKAHTRGLNNGEHIRFEAVKVIHETLLLFSHALRMGNITINFEPTVDYIELYGSPGRLSQIVTNLVANAIDACKENKSGTITLRITTINQNIEFEINDNGCGIMEKNITKIYDPMFTTKPFGEGTGLGLTIVHDIVYDEFGGTITVESNPGKGTMFKLIFPKPAVLSR